MIENQSKFGPKELLAFNKLQARKSYGAVGMLSGMLVVIGLLYLNDDSAVGFVLMIGGIALFPLLMWAIRYNVKTLIKTDRMIQENWTIHHLFEDECLIIETVQGPVEIREKFPYSYLHHAIETDEYLFLFKNAASGYLVDKNGFIQGNLNQLKELLFNKGIKLTSSGKAAKR